VRRSPIASSVTVVNYNAAEEMRKGVPEQSQCGALFTSIASHVIHSSHLDGDYSLSLSLSLDLSTSSRSFLSAYIFRLRRLADEIIRLSLRTGNCSCTEAIRFFLSTFLIVAWSFSSP